MDNSFDVFSATAGLATLTAEINECGLAGDYKVGLATKAFEESQLRQEAFNRDILGLGAVTSMTESMVNSLSPNGISAKLGISEVNTRPAIR